MLDLILTLEGVWSLRDSDVNSTVQTSHADFYNNLYASHFKSATDTHRVLTISASNVGNDSLCFKYSSELGSASRQFLVDKFNIFFPNGHGGTIDSSSSCSSTIFGSVITLDASAGSCSLLVIGPEAGQRVIEKYNLQAEGAELRVRYFISSIEGDYQVSRTYDRRQAPRSTDDTSTSTPPTLSKDAAADMHALLLFPSQHSANNWKRVKSHSASTLQALQIEISIENLHSFINPDASGLAPDSSTSSDSTVIMYRVEVQLGAKDNQPLRAWHVLYRYSHFRAIWTHLSAELADIRESTDKELPDMPPFPPKWPFVKSESSLQYRCKGLQHFMCGITSQGGYEPFVGSRAANMVDLLSAFLEVPNHFVDMKSQPTSIASGSLNSVHYCNSVYHTTPVDDQSERGDSLPRGVTLSPEKRLSYKTNSRGTAPSVFVVVNGARNRHAPMFPHVSLFEWVPIVEYELVVTRVEDNASQTVFRRYKDISCWFQNILDILAVSHSADTLSRLNLPARKSSHINTFSTSSKTDVTGNFVKFRIGELQKSIQSLLTEFPVVVSLPLSQEFLELHKFSSQGSNSIKSADKVDSDDQADGEKKSNDVSEVSRSGDST
mmetsp:Transcript_15736/g.26264  ORF Transcript_15736/g.26264 Transcript_15736/m.26264 type:complete len:607 (+) Transcript_15736:65-1885(+)